MYASETSRFVAGFVSAATQKRFHIVIGITHPQTCLTLTGRLRALREAGFRVTLISSPGELLDRTAAREGVEAIGLSIRRNIAPFADLGNSSWLAGSPYWITYCCIATGAGGSTIFMCLALAACSR